MDTQICTSFCLSAQPGRLSWAWLRREPHSAAEPALGRDLAGRAAGEEPLLSRQVSRSPALNSVTPDVRARDPGLCDVDLEPGACSVSCDCLEGRTRSLGRARVQCGLRLLRTLTCRRCCVLCFAG
ncbi:hypothetical protein GW7_10486 [Heterocephalus glaber]|uniref:Uncharacterized protein n=1 Tax=Heterocephalus glaber TaxID=10181 RepID=G5CAU9_HETGA|nr:hypothetical protein GW7_10486 [Heterocephalus glaber]